MVFEMVLYCLAFSFLKENFLAGDAVPFTRLYQNISLARKKKPIKILQHKSLKGTSYISLSLAVLQNRAEHQTKDRRTRIDYESLLAPYLRLRVIAPYLLVSGIIMKGAPTFKKGW